MRARSLVGDNSITNPSLERQTHKHTHTHTHTHTNNVYAPSKTWTIVGLFSPTSDCQLSQARRAVKEGTTDPTNHQQSATGQDRFSYAPKYTHQLITYNKVISLEMCKVVPVRNLYSVLYLSMTSWGCPCRLELVSSFSCATLRSTACKKLQGIRKTTVDIHIMCKFKEHPECQVKEI